MPHDNAVRRRSQARRSGHARVVKLGRQRRIEIDFDASRQPLDAVNKIGWHGTQDVRTSDSVISQRIERRPHFVPRSCARLWRHGLDVWSRSISVIGWSGDV